MQTKGSNCVNSPIRVIFIHLSSPYSAEIELRIKLFMLKLVCGQNFVLFGHSGYELFGIIWNCRCSDNIYTAAAYSTQMYSIVKTKSLKRCNSCLESKFSQKQISAQRFQF